MTASFGDTSFQVQISGVDEIKAKMAKLPPALIPACEMAVANYLLLQLTKNEIPAWKKVTRASVYGSTFQSDKQRRWFFWALSHGVIDVPYIRNGKHGGVSSQWFIRQNAQGVLLSNDDPAAIYVYGDNTQNKLLGVIGWKRISTITEEKSRNLSGVLDRAAKKAIKDQGLS